MRKLFLYYSLSGNGDAVAACLKEKGFDLCRVEPSKEPPKKFFFQILQCGFNAARRYREPLKPYNTDVSDYERIVIGSPVWNGRLSCPINTVLADTDLKGRNVSFVLCSGSGQAAKAEQQIHKLLPDAAIIHLREPKKNPDVLNCLSDL